MSRMHRPRSVRALAAAVTAIAGLGTRAVVGGMTASAAAAGAQTPAPQHYLCYQAAAKSGFTVPKGIRLINSLSPNGFVPTVGAANVHCNPALKVVPGAQFPNTSPTWHFLGCAITATKQRSGPSPRRTIRYGRPRHPVADRAVGAVVEEPDRASEPAAHGATR